jgi:Tat protein translocase TatB subunit
MFGIGAGELFVIFIIAIVVIGPKQLPDVARTIAKLFTTFKRTGNQLRDQMQEEVKKFQEMEEIKAFKASIESEIDNVKNTTEKYVQAEIEQEEQRFKDEAKNMERELMSEAGPLHEEWKNPLRSLLNEAPEGSVQRMSDAVPDPATSAAPAAAASAAPAAQAAPQTAADTDANGGTPARSGSGDTAPCVQADPGVEEAPETVADTGANGSAPAHSGSGGTAAEAGPGKPLS